MMNRRNFLRLVPALIIAPKLLIPKERQSVWGPSVEMGLKNQLSMLRNNYVAGSDPVIGGDYQSVIVLKKRRGGSTWMYKSELDFAKDWQKQREIAWMQYNMSWMRIHSHLKW